MSLVSPKAYLCVGSVDACSLHHPRLVLEPLARRKVLEFRIPRKPIFKRWTLEREREKAEGRKAKGGRQGFVRSEAAGLRCPEPRVYTTAVMLSWLGKTSTAVSPAWQWRDTPLPACEAASQSVLPHPSAAALHPPGGRGHHPGTSSSGLSHQNTLPSTPFHLLVPDRKSVV